MSTYDYAFKYLIIGNSRVGKSCLFYRFIDDRWEENCELTVGVDFKKNTLDLEGKSVELQIWDTSGQERYQIITVNYYRGANGIMLVYDITNLESFQNLNSWLIQIEKYAPKNALKILIGNKNDLEKDRKVTFEQGKEFADKNGMKFFETSAKESTNVKESFLTMTKDILNEKLKEINNVINEIDLNIKDLKENNKYDIKFSNDSNLLLIQIKSEKIPRKIFEKRISYEELQNNRYFQLFDDIDEIVKQLNDLIKSEEILLFEETNEIILIIPIKNNFKIKEIIYKLEEKEKTNKDLLNDLDEMSNKINNLEKENNELKNKVNNLEKENNDLKNRIENIEKKNK